MDYRYCGRKHKEGGNFLLGFIGLVAVLLAIIAIFVRTEPPQISETSLSEESEQGSQSLVSTSSDITQQTEISTPVVSNWERQFRQDPINDKIFLRYQLLDAQNDGVLLLDCNEDKQIRFNWQYSVTEASTTLLQITGRTYEPLEIDVTMRVDQGDVLNEKWNLQTNNRLLTPPSITALLESLITKSTLALQSRLFESTSVFDIRGIDSAFAEVSSVCSQ